MQGNDAGYGWRRCFVTFEECKKMSMSPEELRAMREERERLWGEIRENLNKPVLNHDALRHPFVRAFRKVFRIKEGNK